jgi:ribose transport system substrate-binding protein
MLKMTKWAVLATVAACSLVLAAQALADDKVVIGFSQASSNAAHRNTMTARNKEYAEKNLPDTKLIITNAEGSSAKQISDVESLEVQGIKVLMISAQDGAAITPTIKDVMGKGIKVVTLERSLSTPVTLHIGPHNEPIGELAGKFVVDKLGGKGNVVEIKGDPAVAPAIERHDGFAKAIQGSGIAGRTPRR